MTVDLKLKSLTIRNWMKFKDVTLNFPEKGLVLVQGVNTASGGALLSVGCHAAGQSILLYSGKTKKVEDIHTGELLMGPDSRPRRVLNLCRGEGKMFRIVPKKGEPFVVNEDHILSLMFTNSPNYPRTCLPIGRILKRL